MIKVIGPLTTGRLSKADSVHLPGTAWSQGVSICIDALGRYFDFSEAPVRWKDRVIWMTISDKKIPNALKVKWANPLYLMLRNHEGRWNNHYVYHNFNLTLRAAGFTGLAPFWIRLEFE